MEVSPNNQRRALFVRIIGSVVVYTIFVITAVSWVMTQNPTLRWGLFVPLVASILILPRDISIDDMTDEVRVRTKLWLSYVRVVYFVVAIFVMLGLPELLS